MERVVIVQDCRPGGTATGKPGTYEGDFPRSVIAFVGEECYEIPHEGHETAVLPDGTKMSDLKHGGEGDCYLIMNNPRIRLDDGSVIWGIECWWKKEKE
jgi:hypothetical protein